MSSVIAWLPVQYIVFLGICDSSQNSSSRRDDCKMIENSQIKWIAMMKSEMKLKQKFNKVVKIINSELELGLRLDKGELILQTV